MDTPGSEFAKENGYVLHHYSEDKNSATYTLSYDDRTVLHLTCRSDGTAELERIIGLIRCTTNNFSYPNKHFRTFENQLISLRSS